MKTENQEYNEQVQPNTVFLNELKQKLPEFVRDDKFDLNKFKTQLEEKNIDELSEGYQLNFIGKDYARRQAGEMPSTVIVPDEVQNKGEGKDSKNLFFTGDNLEVLRHLQGNYQGKIDVIYIDPPYNTGSDDFVYPDNFEYKDEKLKEMFGLDDDQLNRLKSIQGKASHSAWLTFMYPRLALAKRLLADDGVIFISIDDNEQANLKLMMDEIFGEGNFVATVPVITNLKGNQDQFGFASTHEYFSVYAKNVSVTKFRNFKIEDENELSKWSHDEIGYYKKGANLKSTGVNAPREKRPNLYYPIYVSKNNEVSLKHDDYFCDKVLPVTGGKEMSWRWSKERIQNNIYDVIVNRNGGKISLYKKQRPELGDLPSKKPKSVFYKPTYSSGTATNQLANIFGGKYFSFPKPLQLILDILEISSSKNSTILDFFAGSATTADAVMRLNAEDGGKRKFIMVQLPEKTYTIKESKNRERREVPTKGGKVAYDAGYRSIDEISRERIRRAATKIKAEHDDLPADFDGSFKHYRVVKPTFTALEQIEEFDPEVKLTGIDVAEYSSKQLGVAGNATGEATILRTWLTKDGFPFDVDIKPIQFAGYTGYYVGGNRLYLISEGWNDDCTATLVNQLGLNQLQVNTIVVFGYSFSESIEAVKELENALNQLDNKVTFLRRY